MNQIITTILLLTTIVGGANAQGTQANASPAMAHAVMTIEYTDTLQGVSGLLAVRACVAEDEPRAILTNPSVIPNAPPVLSRVEERQTATKHDIVVRVVGADGREVSRHEGATDVCGFARLAGAFLALDRAHAAGDAQ